MNLEPSFISHGLAIAPYHPLDANLQLASLEIDQQEMQHLAPQPLHERPTWVVHEWQLRQRIPGIRKSIVPVDAQTSFEIWQQIPGRMLLPEDFALLRSDFGRVAAICQKLIWLVGALEIDVKVGNPYVTSWEELMELALGYGLKPDFGEIRFCSLSIHPELDAHTSAWSVWPPRWEISLKQAIALDYGFDTACEQSLWGYAWTAPPFCRESDEGSPEMPFSS